MKLSLIKLLLAASFATIVLGCGEKKTEPEATEQTQTMDDHSMHSDSSATTQTDTTNH